jgi:transcriptional regulator GlxA family with amidase domain
MNYVMTLHLARKLTTAADDVRRTAPQSAPSVASISQLCREAGYSFRSVDRFFRQFFGISPKFYARAVRFQRALTMLPNASIGLAEIAFACGYYDQAHLTKEFQAFAAQTPTQYRSHLLEKAAAPPPNLVQFLQEQ